MSLTNRLSLYLLFAALAIFASIAGVFAHFGAQREERLVTLYVSLSMENFADKVKEDLDNIKGIISMSASDAVEALDNKSKILPFVDRIVRSDSLIMGGCIAVVPEALPQLGHGLVMEYVSRDANGQWQAKHLGDSIYNYTQMPWYADAVSSGKPVWSKPYFDKGAGNQLMVTYSYPLKNKSNQVIAVLTADVSVSDLTSEIDRLKPPGNGFAFIIDKNKIFITYPDKSKILSAENNTFATDRFWRTVSYIENEKEKNGTDDNTFRIKRDGEDRLLVFHHIRDTDWIICSVIPYSSIMSNLDLVTFKAVSLLITGLLILALLIRLVVIYSMRPLEKLTGTAELISGGDLDTPLPDMKSTDEISRLNNAFADMQRSLKLQMERLVETTKAKEHVESELHIAKSIQMGLVPHTFSPFPEWEGLELYAMLQSAREVGGDLYDFFIRGSHLFFAIGDVSGKGVPASLFMAVTRTLFRMSANITDSPCQIVTTVNDTIVKDNDECMFVTMFVGMLDLNTGTLRFCNAGHNPAVLADSRGARFMSEAENIPVGVMGGFEYTEETVRLREDEMLLLYTDGLTEAENARKEMFGDDRLLQLISTDTYQSPKDAIERLKTAVAEFADGVDQSDDLTMLCLRLDSCVEPVEKITLTNSMSEIEKLPDVTMRLAQRFGFDDACRNRLNLILEEALVNVIDYAYPEGESGEIELRILHDATGRITFRISDSGTPFDPTLAGNADIHADIEERSIGGLGIFLIKNLSDNVSYNRIDGRNVLTIKVSQS